MILGYARCSTESQDLTIQIAELRAAGAERVYAEKERGMDDNRSELARLLRDVKQGDVIVVSALDRLTRSGPLRMLQTLAQIADKGARYRSLAEPWADTTHEFGEVLVALVGWLAKKSREDILRRTKAGRERAKANGVHFGRKFHLNPAQVAEARRRRAAGETPGAIGHILGVSRQTIMRATQETPDAR